VTKHRLNLPGNLLTGSWRRSIGALLLLMFLTHCGLHAGTGVAPNDPTPSGQILKQGQFFSQSGQTVTGSAVIYLSGSSYILRLEGISTPSEAGLQVRIDGNPGGVVFTSALSATSGNQNYPFSGGVGVTFKAVDIYSTLNSVNYGSAQLN